MTREGKCVCVHVTLLLPRWALTVMLMAIEKRRKGREERTNEWCCLQIFLLDRSSWLLRVVVIVVLSFFCFVSAFKLKTDWCGHMPRTIETNSYCLFFFSRRTMKLSSSSSFLVYGPTYLLVLVVGILLHFVSLPWIPSVLSRVYMIDLVLTCLLFLVGNFLFLSNNIYDLHWPLLPLICAIYFPWATHSIDHLSFKHVLLTTLVVLWSFHLFWQTIVSSEDITHEDWRYQQMRQEYKNHFLLFAFFALHILPMMEVLLGSSALYYVYMNRSRDEQVTLPDALLLAFIFLGVILENVADRQLEEFRQRKKRSRDLRFSVLSTGLWKYSRHPNYLGEMIFWWGLFFFGYIHDAPIWCALGPLFITLMMIFGSIPMSEERMFRKYPEYKFVQTDIPMLVPTFRFTEWICQRAFVRLFFRYIIKVCRFSPFPSRIHNTRQTIIRTYLQNSF